MPEITNIGYVSPFAIHPGETVRETLEFLGMSQVDLATRIELSEKTVSLILNGEQPITPETALKLERVLGLSQKMLLDLQAQYDADVFRLAERERLMSETQYLARYSCYRELAALGLVEKTRDKITKVEELLKFLGVNSLSTVSTVFQVAFRKARSEKVSYESLAAWLRMGTLDALKQEVSNFDKDILEKNIPKMRALTQEPAEKFSQKLVDLCAEAGVVLTYTPHLKNTCVNGAAYWLTPNKALIQLSLYHKYADIFWFTLFHELGHILKHSKKETFIEFENGMDPKAQGEEKEADLFAQRILIPAEREHEFELLKKSIKLNNYVEKIENFSKSLDIDAGIVAGRIGRETNMWQHMARFRKRLEFKQD